MNLLGKTVLAGALSLVSLPALAHDHHGRSEPCHHGRHREGGWRPGPEARREIWVPGHWARRDAGQVWIGAGWSAPPQPAWVWVQPRWVWEGGGWRWREAHWAPPS